LDEEEDIRRSANPRLNVELALVRMAYLEPMIPIDEVLAKMGELEKRLSPEQKLSVSPVQKQSHILEEEQLEYEVGKDTSNDNLWEKFKGFVKKESFLLWSKIEPGRFLGYENRCLRVGFPNGYVFLDYLNEKSHKDHLTKISREFFKEDVAIKIESVEPDAEDGDQIGKNGITKVNRMNDIKKEALCHPLVQKVIDVFEGAEIREVIPIQP
jgi:DNA polymerase-3 subunit gamma/tau